VRLAEERLLLGTGEHGSDDRVVDSNAEVAKILEAQTRTVEKHLERIYKKLGVDNRFAAILAVIGQSDRR
jgi:hypothetical protein